MAVTMLKPRDEEHRLLMVLLKRHFDWTQEECFPNVQVFNWESDLLLVSKSGYVTEVEVKCNFPDLKNDSKKKKFTYPAYRQEFDQQIRRFYYAVPGDMAFDSRCIPAWAGILLVRARNVVETREAQTRYSAQKIKPEALNRLRRSVYFRFHREYQQGVQGRIDVRTEVPRWES